MKYTFIELFDQPKIKELMLKFFRLTGIPSAIIDLEGNFILTAGWKRNCMGYNGEDLDVCGNCNQCELIMRSGTDFLDNEPYYMEKCSRGIIIARVPINIEENTIAMLIQTVVEEAEAVEKLNAALAYAKSGLEIYGEMEFNRIKLLEQKMKDLLGEQKRLKTIFDRIANIGIQICDQNGKVLYLNRASVEIFGWSSAEVFEKSLDQLMFDQESFKIILNNFKELIQGIKIKPREWLCCDKQGNNRTILFIILPIFEIRKYEFICLSIDLTEYKKYEKDAARLERLNLVGEMAAGMGHEVRNPLTTVRGFLQVLSKKMESQNYKEYFQLMIQELDRANSIITEFLLLAKNRPIRPKKIDLNQIINSLRPLIEANAVLSNQTFEIQSVELPFLEVDEKEIRQLIINLARNAIEAMHSGGHLLIKTSYSGDEVILSVHDTGMGMDSEMLENLGTPFISTKENGTGLGLAMCYSIALRNHAVIQVQSTPKGTTFFVHFKRSQNFGKLNA
ncbi:ATP-binding protein [Desulfitobacterium sp. AusDCA]|uniref:ATP-binding protein n=1 Tax=Desulfitobacterium sp. AusDCA TaxID=3240383 RepID=UPI003DA6DCD1